MSTATRRQRLEAQRAQLESLLESIPQNRRLERLGFESQLEEVQRELETLTASPGIRPAETDLVFYGTPVVEADGIDAVFASNVISSYQDLVTKAHAARESVLKGSGPVPGESLSHLHITGVIHGSFGFQLREIVSSDDVPAQTSLFTNETPLYATVEAVAALVEAAGQDDDAFVDLVQDLNPRVHDAMRQFFEVVRKAGASFSLATATRTTEFDYDRIAAAMDRASVTIQDEQDKRVLGVFLGALGGSRVFEHQADAERIRGKADPNLDLTALTEWQYKQCVAVLRVTRWQRGGRTLLRYTLLGLEAPQAGEGPR